MGTLGSVLAGRELQWGHLRRQRHYGETLMGRNSCRLLLRVLVRCSAGSGTTRKQYIQASEE
jgi:hypothetical protein